MSKILVIEDDPMLVEIYRKKLADCGYEIKTLTNGVSVKEEMMSWKPDLVLLDIVLPDIDGFEILENIKKESSIKDIPVYIFSNLSVKEDFDRATGLGAAGFLTKSKYTPSQLAEEVKKIIGKNPPLEKKESEISPTKEFSTKEAKKRKFSKHRILIIEDEDVFITMFKDRLEQEGFEVIAAKNGRWGIKEAEKGNFSCILLDMMMPAMNGYEAIQELRSCEKTKETPIIILSNSALDSEVEKAKNLGANAYHIKTQITPGELTEEIKELVKD